MRYSEFVRQAYSMLACACVGRWHWKGVFHAHSATATRTRTDRPTDFGGVDCTICRVHLVPAENTASNSSVVGGATLS